MGEKSASQKRGRAENKNAKRARVNQADRKERKDDRRAAKLDEYRKRHGLTDDTIIIIQNDSGPEKHIDHGKVVLLSPDGKTLVLSIEFFFNVFLEFDPLTKPVLQDDIGEVDPEKLGLDNPKLSDHELEALANEFPPVTSETDEASPSHTAEPSEAPPVNLHPTDPIAPTDGSNTAPISIDTTEPIRVPRRLPGRSARHRQKISPAFPMNIEETRLLFENLQTLFPLIFAHALARGMVVRNGAMRLLAELERQGRMHGFGYRSTRIIGQHQVPDKFVGSYALNMTAAKNLKRLTDDVQRSNILPYIDNFLAEMFARLSLSAFKSNNDLATSLGAGSWASKTWYNSNNAKVFGTSFMMTDHHFRNGLHCDKDATQYALITWGLINKYSGVLISHQERLDLLQKALDPRFRCQALGALFYIGNCVVHLDAADVIIATINVKVPHRTDHPLDISAPLAKDLPGQHVDRFGSSVQVSKSISDALKKIGDLRGDVSEEEWEVQRQYYGQSYVEEAERKWNWKGGLKSKLKTDLSLHEYTTKMS